MASAPCWRSGLPSFSAGLNDSAWVTISGQEVRQRRPARQRNPPELRARAKKRPHVAVVESDNWTFRPTVLVRRGSSQGTGTIIASLDGETLVLTAAHVIRGRGAISVELHRYNLGIEHQPSVPGKWPRQVVAEPVASDTFADLAILRLRDMIALPFVAPGPGRCGAGLERRSHVGGN